jgi:hypothetical protein
MEIYIIWAFKFFLRTHSPITVSFVPRENLFQMKFENKNYLIEKVSFRRQGLRSLTSDLIPNFNNKSLKIVYVEGLDDVHFYYFIYKRSF